MAQPHVVVVSGGGGVLVCLAAVTLISLATELMLRRRCYRPKHLRRDVVPHPASGAQPDTIEEERP